MTTQWFSEAFDPLALPERLVAVYDYWLSQRRGGKLPSWDSFNPLALPVGVQPYIAILELTGSPGNSAARFRLVGTKVVALFGIHVIGETLAEAMKSPGASLVQDLTDSLLEGRKPLYVKIANSRTLTTKKPIENLLLPLAYDGAIPDLAISVYHWQE